MSRPILWLSGAIVGIAAIVVSTLGLVPMLLTFLLAWPLVNRPGGSAALSGVLISFGSVWLALMAAESASGGTLDNASFWAAVGLVPLAAGLALLAALVVRAYART